MTSTGVPKPPKARPAAVPVALVLAACLAGLAVVAVRDLAVSQGWAGGSTWSRDVVRQFDGATASPGMVVGGVIAAVLGLLLIWWSVKPGRVTHLRASSPGEVWLSPRALGALAVAVAERAPGVVSAEATRFGKRRVVIEAVTTQDAAEVSAGVRAALDASLSDLTAARLRVHAKGISQ